jgi:hypothetical protein
VRWDGDLGHLEGDVAAELTTFALDGLTGCGAPPMHPHAPMRPRKYEQARMLDRQGKKTERMTAVREARQLAGQR